MISIPIGETFEAIIDWLKDTFAVVFTAISAVLNFAIEALENVLLLRHDMIYPSIALALLAAFLGWFFGKRTSKQAGIIAAVAAFAVLSVAEIWRYTQLESSINSAKATEMVATFDSLSSALQEVAEEEYQFGLAALQSVRQAGALGEEAADRIDGIERELDRMRPNRFDDAEDEFMELLEDVPEEDDLSFNRDQMAILREASAYYSAFSLLESMERVVDDLEDIGEENPQLARGFINVRAYDRLQRRLDATATLDLAWANSPAFTEAHGQVKALVKSFNPDRLRWYTWAVLIILLTMLAQIVAGRGLAIFTLIGFLLIVSMGFWEPTMESLALVLSATLFALIIGIPVGISAARNDVVDKITRPILDFMQTMPAFVYLIPAVLFFGLGKVPGAMATLIFAMPPAVRLTSLGIRQVPSEVVEACLAFGATPKQLLYKAQLPIARPTILAGLNQTIMLALSMVVIGGMIGAGGLGQEVLSGITQLKIGLGFESGISVVILAIYLDRITQTFGGGSK